MYYVLITIHVVICFFLIIVVLLQSGKAADLAGAFGGMGSQTAFGPRGAATVLSKATTLSAVLFMITSITLSILATRRGATSSSVLEGQKTSRPAPAKTTPVGPASVPAAPGQPVDIQLLPAQPGQQGQGQGHAAPAQQPGHSAPAQPPPAGHNAPGHSEPAGHNAPPAKK